MKKRRFTEAQIVGILKELNAGTPANRACTKARRACKFDSPMRDRYGGLETGDLVSLNTSRRERADAAHHRAANPEIEAMKAVFLKNDFGGVTVLPST